MGDRTSVSMEIGGGLPRSLIEQFVACCVNDGMGHDYDRGPMTEALLLKAAAEEGAPLMLYGNEINYANCDELEAFCKEHGLVYRKEWDAGGGFGPGAEVWDVIAKVSGEAATYGIGEIGDDPQLSAREIKIVEG